MSKMYRSWRDNETDEDKNFLVVNGLKKLYSNEKFADCKFLVGRDRKVTFKAHKLVLAMVSEVFENEVYSHTSNEPILVPDVNPVVFKKLLRYIYMNEFPLNSIFHDDYGDGIFEMAEDNQQHIIDLWYATNKYGLHNLSDEFYNMIKVNLTNWIYVYSASKKLLRCGYDDSNISTLISKCKKVFSVKTPEAIGASDFAKHIHAISLRDLFSLEHLNIGSELELFKAFVKYANERDWTPNDQYLLEKDKNGTERLTPLQKSIREVLKQIRFLTMTLKEFDSIPSKSGFFTEFEVETIRNRIADDSSQCVSIVGFSKNTTKRRHELIQLKNIKNAQEHNEDLKDIEKLAFNVEFPQHTLSITEPFTFGNLVWRILIYQRKLKNAFGTEYTIYLKCDVPETKDWKFYAQLDLAIELGKEKVMFENIPWFCFKCNNNYSQMKPFKLNTIVRNCNMELAISPHHVSYKNRMSSVSVTYGKDTRTYE